MGKLTRKIDRKGNRASDRELAAMSFEGRLLILAGESLGLSAQQISQLGPMFAKLEKLREEQILAASEEDVAQVVREMELADMVMARLAEMFELMKQRHTVPAQLVEAANTAHVGRAEVEQRQGAGFYARVAAMGKPALQALVAAGLAVLLFLVPSLAKAAQSPVVSRLDGAHKIQRRNRRALLGRVGAFPYNFRRRGWIRSKRSYATSGRLSQSYRASVTGCAPGRESSARRARATKSSWSGGSVASASGAYPMINPTSQLNVPTARSSARRGASQAKGAVHGNA